MKLRAIKLKNFRCYKDEVRIDFDSFTALIGKNDVGKSTILDALAIFFENQKADSDDAAKDGDATEMTITCEFDEIPTEIVIDATHKTSLESEYLLNQDGRLEITRIYNGSLKTPTVKTFIQAEHPTAEGVEDLLSLKNAELKTRARSMGINLSEVNQSINFELRSAIRNHLPDLLLGDLLLEVDANPGAKEIYGKIKEIMPLYFLFRADRSSTDQDSEAQDPLKIAVRIALEEQREILESVSIAVHEQIMNLLDATLEKISAMSPEVANALSPEISEPKWDAIFKVGLSSDTSIPLNKRGSGVRRMVLLGFLQAQAESKKILSPDLSIIYAIEEPETSQHPDKQRALLHALRELSDIDGYQVLITTHTPMLGRLLPESMIRFISDIDNGRFVHPAGEATTRLIAETLGVLPDHDVKIFVGVEGKHDEIFLKEISKILSQAHSDISSLEALEVQGKLIFVPAGGSNVGLWTSRLHNLNIFEYHIFDRDYAPPLLPHYHVEADLINARPRCKAVHTSKAELENYLHQDAIMEVHPEIYLGNLGLFDDVPYLVAEKIHDASLSPEVWSDIDRKKKKDKADQTKKWLNRDACRKMSIERLSQVDPNSDIETWLREITYIARN